MAKILYIAGWGRSGTTLFGNVLGQATGFESVGEVHNIWKRGLIDGRDCGCGRRLMECPFWTKAFDFAFGGFDGVDANDVVRAQVSLRTRGALKLLRSVRRGSTTRDYGYAAPLRSLYDGIAAASGARVIVDSSKFPLDPLLVLGGDHEVFVVHMVRDPRAVAYSWSRRKVVQDKTHGGGVLPRVGLFRSTLVWQFYNGVIATVDRFAVGRKRYLRVDYEAFATDPKGAVEKVLAFVGEPSDAMPSLVGGQIDLVPTHTAGGNPDRFRHGVTTIRPDSAWRTGMPRLRRWAVAALAFPALPLTARPNRSAPRDS